MPASQVDLCLSFLGDFEKFLLREMANHRKRSLQQNPTVSAESSDTAIATASSALPQFLQAGIQELKDKLGSGVAYSSLPAYSKAQRACIAEVEATYVAARSDKDSLNMLNERTADKENISTEGDAASADEADAAEAAAASKERAQLHVLCKDLFPPGFSIFEEFLGQWTAVVPKLTLLGQQHQQLLLKERRRQQLKLQRKKERKDAIDKKIASCAGDKVSGDDLDGGSGANAAAAVGEGNEEGEEGEGEGGGDDQEGEDDEDEEEFVEQEGCPDDTDFNRWSHHCTVGTCDDELLSRSMADDATVSFVFGLEVNWSLLEQREAEMQVCAVSW